MNSWSVTGGLPSNSARNSSPSISLRKGSSIVMEHILVVVADAREKVVVGELDRVETASKPTSKIIRTNSLANNPRVDIRGKPRGDMHQIGHDQRCL